MVESVKLVGSQPKGVEATCCSFASRLLHVDFEGIPGLGHSLAEESHVLVGAFDAVERCDRFVVVHGPLDTVLPETPLEKE